jgi:hypothetical protein
MVTLEPNRKLSPHYLPSIHPSIHPGVLEGAGSFRLSSWGLGGGRFSSFTLLFLVGGGGGGGGGLGGAWAPVF